MFFRNDKVQQRGGAEEEGSTFGIIGGIIYLLSCLMAIYFSWKCVGGFNLIQFLIAICCPICYLIGYFGGLIPCFPIY